MLTHLCLKDFVIVRELNLDVQSGLTVLTGETGAGKSILIEALEMILGARTDVGVIRGVLGVAENGRVRIPQTMKEKAVCFISEYLVIILDHTKIVDNMHEAYRLIEMNDYGYGTFISGPSKAADLAQALVMGAQAARGVTVILI